MITAERLATLLSFISEQRTEYNCNFYIDSLKQLMKQNLNFCSKTEQDFIEKILFWEINSNFETNKKYPLTPTFLPGYKNNMCENLMAHCFDTSRINTLIELRNHASLNIELRARINDILWLYKHSDPAVRNQKIDFAKDAIQCYIDSAKQQINKQKMTIRLVRAVNLILPIKNNIETKSMLEILNQYIIENLDINNYTIEDLTLLELLYKLDLLSKEDLLEKNESILNNNHPIPKTSMDVLIRTYDFFINHTNDTSKKEFYCMKRLECLLWFSNSYLERHRYPMALDCANNAEKELNKLKVSKNDRDKLYEEIKTIKEKSNQPPNMQFQKIQIKFEPPTGIDMQNSSPLEIFKAMLDYFKHIDYKEIQNSMGPLYTTSELLIPDKNENLTHDEKPTSITKYSDDELIKIDKFYSPIRHILSAYLINYIKLIASKDYSALISSLDNNLKNTELKEKKEIILTAIERAFSGDMCSALSIIIPQMEDFFRIKIQSRGGNLRDPLILK